MIYCGYRPSQVEGESEPNQVKRIYHNGSRVYSIWRNGTLYFHDFVPDGADDWFIKRKLRIERNNLHVEHLSAHEVTNREYGFRLNTTDEDYSEDLHPFLDFHLRLYGDAYATVYECDFGTGRELIQNIIDTDNERFYVMNGYTSMYIDCKKDSIIDIYYCSHEWYVYVNNKLYTNVSVPSLLRGTYYGTIELHIKPGGEKPELEIIYK